MLADGASTHKIDYFRKFEEIPIFEGILKLHYWFKSYGIFAERGDFAYCWSCFGKGLRLQPAQQACLYSLSIRSLPNNIFIRSLEWIAKSDLLPAPAGSPQSKLISPVLLRNLYRSYNGSVSFCGCQCSLCANSFVFPDKN